MTIQEQIEAAYKAYYEEYYAKCRTGPLSIGSFEAGYLAALRGLFLRKVEQLSVGEIVMIAHKGELVKAYLCDERTHFLPLHPSRWNFEIPVEEAGELLATVADLPAIPTPSTLFGEGV